MGDGAVSDIGKQILALEAEFGSEENLLRITPVVGRGL